MTQNAHKWLIAALFSGFVGYCLFSPDPIQESIGKEAADVASEMRLQELRSCLAEEQDRFGDDPTDEQYAIAEELCSE